MMVYSCRTTSSTCHTAQHYTATACCCFYPSYRYDCIDWIL